MGNDGCVKFAKDSWHYKITHYVFPSIGYSTRTNLCPYMRMVIASIVSLPFMIGWNQLPYRIRDQAWIFQAELIYLALVMIVAGFIDILETTYETDIMPTFIEMVAIGFFAGNFIGLFFGGLILGGSALIDYIKQRPKKEHRTRGLIKTYVQSKHDKICPCVEFE